MGKGVLRPIEIADGSDKDRKCTQMIASRMMMKSHRQLNHALEMTTQGQIARHRAPDILENFVRVEKLDTVEQIDALSKLPVIAVIVRR